MIAATLSKRLTARPSGISVTRKIAQDNSEPASNAQDQLTRHPSEDAEEELVGTRAKSGANTDLARALRDGERHQRIDPGR